MNNLLARFLPILKWALQNPEDKAAVQIASDGVAWWEKVSTMPETLRIESDIGEYEKLVAARLAKEHPQPAPAPLPGQGPQPDLPSDVQVGERGGARGGLMDPRL